MTNQKETRIELAPSRLLEESPFENDSDENNEAVEVLKRLRDRICCNTREKIQALEILPGLINIPENSYSTEAECGASRESSGGEECSASKRSCLTGEDELMQEASLILARDNCLTGESEPKIPHSRHSIAEKVLILEILALLSSTRDKAISKYITSHMDWIFAVAKDSIKEISRPQICIIRAFRIIVQNVSMDIFFQKFFPFFYSIIEIDSNSSCVYACKSEALNILHKAINIPEVVEALSKPCIVQALSTNSLESLQLLENLISEKTLEYVNAENIFNGIANLDVKNKLKALRCLVKWYCIKGSSNDAALKRILQEIYSILRYDKGCLVLIGRMVDENLYAQVYCKEKGILSDVLDLYDESNPLSLTPELVYCVYALISNYEQNRKEVSQSKFMGAVFGVLKASVSSGRFDDTFILIIYFFRNMTRSILFLRSELLSYPIVELLLTALEKIEVFKPVVHCAFLPNTRPTTDFIIDSIIIVLINLVMEYGNYKSKFIKTEGIKKILVYKEKFPHTILKLLKNFLYDTTWYAKEVFIKNTNKQFFTYFFEKSKDDLEMLRSCFNLIRNLICDNCIDLVIYNYDSLLTPIFTYLKDFSSMDIDENSPEEGVMVQILYVLVNLSAGSVKYKDLVMLPENLEMLKQSGKTRSLQIALIWIIINLTWKDEGSEERVNTLKQVGFKDWLLGVKTEDPVLSDKIGTALEHLR